MISRKSRIAVLLGTAFCALVTHAFADDAAMDNGPYPKFRGDLQNTGRAEGKGAKGKELWSIDAGIDVSFSPVVGNDGWVYFVSDNHKVYGLDKTGKGWVIETETFAGSAAAAGQAAAVGKDGTVYFPDAGGYDDENRGRLVAFDGKTGAQKWAFKAKASVYSSPAIGANGLIYFGSQDGFLYAVNGDGEQQWKFDTGGQVRASPAIGKDGTIYIGSHSRSVFALDGKTGKQKWEFTAAGIHVESSCAIGDDGTVYVGTSGSMTTGPSYLYALDGKTGKKKWEVEECTGPSSVAIGRDGTIFTQGESGNFYAIDPKTGAKKWTAALGGIPQVSSPAVGGDGTVYVAAGSKLYALDPETGNQKWDFQTGTSIYSSPAIASDGTIYIGSGDGKLYAIK